MGASIGVGSYPGNGLTLAQLLRHADQEMYRIKHASDGVMTALSRMALWPPTSSRDRLVTKRHHLVTTGLQ